MTIQEARLAGERRAGKHLGEAEFARVLDYTVRKSRSTGHDDSYIPLLLQDEVFHHIHRQKLNLFSVEMADYRREINQRKEDPPCVSIASQLRTAPDALTSNLRPWEIASIAKSQSWQEIITSGTMESCTARTA